MAQDEEDFEEIEEVYVARDAAEVEQTAHDVLADPEYRHLFRERAQQNRDEDLPDWLKRFLEWMFGGTPSRSGGISESVMSLGRLLFWGVVALLVVLCIAILVTLWKQRQPSVRRKSLAGIEEEAISPTSPPGDLSTNEYERRALAAAHAGDFRAALRELVLGSMSWTERAGLIRYRRGLTNRDYVRAVWRRVPQRESLLKMIGAFERVFFGRRPADELTFQTCLAEFRGSFAKEDVHAPLAG